MNNKIIDVQEVVFKQLKRLSDDAKMQENGAEEIARSSVIANSAQTFIKAVNLNLRIMEFASREQKEIKQLAKSLGLVEDETV